MSDAPRPERDFAFEFRPPPGLEIVSRLSVGRRAQWFEAEQVRLGRAVALKFLRPFLAESETFREAFFEAGRQASLIVHPAALPIFNVFPDHCCIVMELCRRKPLGLLEGALSPLQVVKVGEAVLDCLSALHATGRCHGNISPGNIFFDEGEVFVNDFFHPPVMADGRRTYSGDRRHIAPEALSGGARDWRSDLYSLGRVLSEVLGGEGGGAELRQLLESLVEEDPSRRAVAPEDALESFRRVKRLEAARAGARGTIRRKRMYRRVPADFTVSLRKRSATPDETAIILMKTRDIGESGVFVETDDELVVGSILELDFALRGVEGNVHAFGIVRWKSEPPMPRGLGVQFVEVDQESLMRLREYLGRRERTET